MQPSANRYWAAAILGVILVAGALTFGTFGSGPAPAYPDIVYITIDSLRADHMGAYGYGKPTTPFLDSLFARGAVFEHAYAPGYLTFQTNASVLSGLYPSQNNVTTWETPLRDNVQLLPEILKLYGYSTGAFVSPSMWKYFGFTRGFDTYELTTEMKSVAAMREKIVDWFARAKGPRFVFWHIYDAHLPYIAAKRPFLENPYDGPFASTTRRFNWVAQSTSSVPATGGMVPIGNEDRRYLGAAYDTGIRAVDDAIRVFYAEIGGSADYRNTIFIVAAEHGEDLGEHGFIFHRDLYDDNVRVPFAIVYPARVSPKRIASPVSLLDVMPTVLALANIAPKEGIEGIDLGSALKGGRAPKRDIFAERQPFKEYAIVDWPYKYISRNPRAPSPSLSELDNLFFYVMRKNDPARGDELYDLVADPGETHSLIGQGLAEEATLKARLLEFKARMEEAAETDTPAGKPAETLIPYF